MNILIVGLGNIGRSHLNGLLDTKFKKNIYLYDKKKIILDNKELIFLKEIPQNKDFDLVIIATDVRDRLSIIKKILKNNIIKYLLIEKYIFKNLKEFYTFEKIYLKKIKKYCLVNCWGEILFKKLKITHSNEKFQMHVLVSHDSFLTSFLHSLEMFQFLNKNKKFSLNKEITKRINSKRKSFKELRGSFLIESQNGSKMIYESKKIKYGFIIILKYQNKSFKIYLDNKYFINIKSDKISRKEKFPLSFMTTKDLLLNIYKNRIKNIQLPKYKKISVLNKRILYLLKDTLSGNKFT